MRRVGRKGGECQGDAHHEQADGGIEAALLGIEAGEGDDERGVEIHDALEEESVYLFYNEVRLIAFTVAQVPIMAVLDEPSNGS